MGISVSFKYNLLPLGDGNKYNASKYLLRISLRHSLTWLIYLIYTMAVLERLHLAAQQFSSDFGSGYSLLMASGKFKVSFI